MSITAVNRTLMLVAPFVLGGCAASQMPGFQNAYQGYSVPENLVDRIRLEFKNYSLPNAQVARDNVGRIRLTGQYRDEDEVDRAYIIVQSIIGIKSTSPFYPEHIQDRRWEIDTRRAIAEHNKARTPSNKGVKRALIIGINTFLDGKHLRPILGEDDARRVKIEVERANYMATTLLGPEATKANIEKALERMKQEVGPDDTLLIYISSHGTLPTPSPRVPDARKMSIAAYDTGDAAAAGLTAVMLKIHDTSVADTKVQELAQKRTRQTRVIIDTCYSGEILRGIPDESSKYILKTNGGAPEAASISMAAWSGEAYSSKGIFFSEDQSTKTTKRMPVSAAQQADFSRYTIITATSDSQLSWGPSSGKSFESPVDPTKQLQGSFFTQAFFEYLGKNGGHIAPAFAAAQKFTYEKVAKIPPPNGPVEQRPRLNPPLSNGDASNIYE